jgi:hypothetical protein
MNRATLGLALATTVLCLAPLAAQAAAKPPKQGQNSLTIAASTSPVVFGRSTAISGKLLGPNAGGQKINLRADPFPFDKAVAAGSATTSAAGDWTLAQSPTVNTRYQARAGSVESPVITVLVRPAVSMRVSDSTPKRGRRVRFAGRVCPEHDGARLVIQRRSKDGRYRTVARATLRDRAGSTCSRYRRALRIRRDGRYRALIAAHSDHAAGRSRSRLIDVHR